MSIFKRAKEVTHPDQRSFSEIYDDCTNELEKVVNLALKASGVELTDMLDGLDEETGAVVGGLMASCNKLTGYSAEMVAKYDSLENKVNEMRDGIKETNRKLEKILLAVQNQK